jgi:hypothetical protein
MSEHNVVENAVEYQQILLKIIVNSEENGRFFFNFSGCEKLLVPSF